MTIFRNFMKGATAIAAMVALPVAASAAPLQTAQALSVASSVRADVTGEGENGQFGEGGGWILPVIIVVAIGVGLYFALEEDDDAVSP